jgi:hypothetical protein
MLKYRWLSWNTNNNMNMHCYLNSSHCKVKGNWRARRNSKDRESPRLDKQKLCSVYIVENLRLHFRKSSCIVPLYNGWITKKLMDFKLLITMCERQTIYSITWKHCIGKIKVMSLIPSRKTVRHLREKKLYILFSLLKIYAFLRTVLVSHARMYHLCTA